MMSLCSTNCGTTVSAISTCSLHLRGRDWDYSTVIWSHSISCPSITYDQTIYKREQVDIDNSRSMLLVVGYVIWECFKVKGGLKRKVESNSSWIGYIFSINCVMLLKKMDSYLGHRYHIIIWTIEYVQITATIRKLPT